MNEIHPIRVSAVLRTVIISAGLFLGGCLTDDTDDGDGNGGTALKTRTAIVGAHDNATIGSSIDLDSMEVFTYADAAQEASRIDLFYAFSETESAVAFYAPLTAKVGFAGSTPFGAGRGGPADWAEANDTPMRRVTVAEFDQIDTQRELDSLWNAGDAVEGGRLLVAENMDFMAETDEGMRTLIKVLEILPGATGSAGIRVKATFPQITE